MSRFFRVQPVVSALILFFFLGCPLAAGAASPFSYPVGTVILDPGHGGHDPGASARWEFADGGMVIEKDVVLDLALRIRDQLIAIDPEIRVLLTRDDDSFLSLADRAKFAGQTNPGVGASSVLISIHVNSAASGDPSGFEVLIKKTEKRVGFLDANSPDWALARYAAHTVADLNVLLNRSNLLLADSVRSSIADTFPRAKDRGIKEQNVWVLNASTIPSVLIEVGFIGNESDARDLVDEAWRNAMAKAVAQAVFGYDRKGK